MAGVPVDFATVQWARKRTTDLEALAQLSASDMGKIASLLERLAVLKATEVEPTTARLTVLLQNLHTKNL
ncbi:MAG: hypothetical protein AAF629_28055, partial [Chloroflexota bacterium]